MTTKNPSGGLLDLIERKRNGRTNPELSRASGGVVSDATLANLKSRGVRGFPQPATIRGYAEALNVSVTEVVFAIAVSLGMKPEELGAGDSDALVIDDAGRLPSESRQMLRDMAGMMLAWMDQVEAAPSDTALEDDRLPDGYDLAAHHGEESPREVEERVRDEWDQGSQDSEDGEE